MLALLALRARRPTWRVALVNRVVTTRPRPDGRCRGSSCADGVPPSLRTLVAVPTLLTDAADVEEQIERLEIHYLANPDGDLQFALLSDWLDAPTESVPGDDELLAAAVAGDRPAQPPSRRRARRRRPLPAAPSPARLERGRGRWMGWERKRGKLHELNRLLRGATRHDFLPTARRRDDPADGRPLRHHARRRHAAAARRRRGAWSARWRTRSTGRASTRAAGRVVEGYAILQPRVTPVAARRARGLAVPADLLRPGRHRSLRRPRSPTSTRTCSAKARYTGKGIYDVDAFEAALAGRVPENALLSHDLFEGIFARAGLVSDVEVVEEFPSRYDVAAARQHRWARGDWQLLPWILGRARDAAGQRTRERRSRASAAGRCSTTCAARCRRPLTLATLARRPGRCPSRAAPTCGPRFVLATVVIPAAAARRWPVCCRGGAASRSAATCGAVARRSRGSPPPRSALRSSPSSPTRRG